MENELDLEYEREGYVCDTPWKADRCMCDLAELEELESFLKADYEKKRGQIATRRLWLENAVKFYASTQMLESGGKIKTVDLPHGRAQFRKLPARVDIDNLEAFMAWAKASAENARLLRVKEEPDKVAIKEAIVNQETGEIVDIPGIVYMVPDELGFSVKPRMKGEENGE